MVASIASLVVKYLQQFNELITSGRLSQHQDEVPLALWEDELGRLRVWAANIGAHQTGLSSLDYRLRDASHVKEQLFRLLRRLQRAYADILDSAATGEIVSDSSDLSDSSDSGNDGVNETEAESIYNSLRETINCLFQISMVIRQPAHHDRLLGTQKLDAVPFEHFDRGHVLEKFPKADEKMVNLLGKAISERRAVLRYRQRHHEKLSHGIKGVLTDQPDAASTKLSETIATEFVKSPTNTLDVDTKSRVSQTSYAPTLLGGEKGMTIPPPPPGSANGAYFECPYCFYIITISSRGSWARHIFHDLMPYVCTFPECTAPKRLYESRHEWYSHVQQEHLANSGNSAQICPLCRDQVTPGPHIEKHLARHLEELALFALPRLDPSDDFASEASRLSAGSMEERMAGLEGESSREPDSTTDSDQAIDNTEFFPESPGLNTEGANTRMTKQTGRNNNTMDDPEAMDFSEINEYRESGPDRIILNDRRTFREIHFPPYSIAEGVLTIGDLRQRAAEATHTSEPIRIKLLFKGKLLDDDSLPCRAEGIEDESEIMCVVSEILPNQKPLDSSDISEGEEWLKRPGMKGKRGKIATHTKKGKEITENDSPTNSTEAMLQYVRRAKDLDDASRWATWGNTSQIGIPTGLKSFPPPAPDLNAFATPLDQVYALTAHFHEKLLPLCDTFTSDPPKNARLRDFEHKKLSETILAQIILKADSIEAASDKDARLARLALIKETQTVLTNLDTATRNYDSV